MSVPLGLRVEPKDGSNVLGGSQSYATAEEFESPQVLAMNWWIGEDANRNGHWALGVREHIPSIESPSTGTCIRANVPTPMGMG